MWPKSLSCRTWVDEILKFYHPSTKLSTVEDYSKDTPVWSFKRVTPHIYGTEKEKKVRVKFKTNSKSKNWISSMWHVGVIQSTIPLILWMARIKFQFKGWEVSRLELVRDLCGGCQLSHGCANWWQKGQTFCTAAIWSLSGNHSRKSSSTFRASTLLLLIY